MDPTDVAQCSAVLSSSSTSSRPVPDPPRASTARSSCGVCVHACVHVPDEQSMPLVAHICLLPEYPFMQNFIISFWLVSHAFVCLCYCPYRDVPISIRRKEETFLLR